MPVQILGHCPFTSYKLPAVGQLAYQTCDIQLTALGEPSL